MAYVRNPVVYVPDLTNGRPIVDGKVYLLTSGTVPPMHDSTIDPLDLLTVTYINEAGNTVEQPQPLYTSKGGCLYGNFPDAARQFMIAPQAYVFAAYNRIGELQYSAETSASDYVETDALAAVGSTVLIAGVPAFKYKAVKVFGHYVTDRDDASSVAAGWTALLAELNDGDVIVFDGMFKTPVQADQLILENFKNVVLWGGGFYRWAGCSEHIIRFHTCEGILVHAMSFIGVDTAWFQWGFQGLYTRDCVNTLIDGCKFKDIGDAAIRTCRVTETYYPPTTNGIVITNCFFTNCTQVTTSGTGALKYIFTGNVCENMYSLKIARRNTEETGWHLVYGNHFKNCGMGVELQGANKVKFFGNTVVGESLARMYGNDETFGSTWVANKDIFIDNNDFIATANTDCIHISNQNSNIATPTDVDGVIEITNNRMTQNFSGSRGAIFASSYAGAKLTNKLTIRGNRFLGTQHVNLLASQSSNPLSMSGMDLDISDNEGSFTSWFLSIIAHMSSTVTNGSFVCENNRIDCAGIIDLTYSGGVLENFAVLKEYVVNNNTFKTTGVLQHLKLGFEDKLPIAQHIEVTNNKFKVDTNTGGDVIRFTAPPASRAASHSYDISHNRFILTGTFVSTTAKPRAMIAPVQPTFGSVYPLNMIADDNVWVGTEARAPRSDNSALPLSLRTIVKRSRNTLESGRILLSSTTSTNINGVSGTIRTIKVYSDSSVEISGIWKNAAGNSFNLIFGVTLADTNYQAFFSPVYTESLTQRIVSKVVGSLVMRFSTVAAVDVTPFYDFFITGKLSESEMLNYV
jgi:hypothetical protein